jgi:hypothetical protein
LRMGTRAGKLSSRCDWEYRGRAKTAYILLLKLTCSFRVSLINRICAAALFDEISRTKIVQLAKIEV